MTKDITWLRKGYCDVRGIIRFNPSNNSLFNQFSVYSKDGTLLGIVDPLTHENRKLLEKFNGRYVKFRSSAPNCNDSERIFFLYLKS